MKQLSLIERLGRLNDPYKEKGRRHLQEMSRNSVRARVERFLKTRKGAALVDENYGMDLPSEVSARMGSNNIPEKQEYLRTLGGRIASCDRRIKRVLCNEGKNRTDTDSVVIPFIEIEVTLQEELGVNEYREPFRFVMAYDLTGRVFDVKMEDNT